MLEMREHSQEEVTRLQKETEEKLKDMGLAPITEPLATNEIPLKNFGLLPCQRARLESERNIEKKNSRLEK